MGTAQGDFNQFRAKVRAARHAFIGLLASTLLAPGTWAGPAAREASPARVAGPHLPLDLSLPTENRFPVFPRTTADENPSDRFRDLGAAYAQASKSAGIPAMVQRVRREGLPVARLWESKSALLSLGFNGRGKPGIWLVQKIP